MKKSYIQDCINRYHLGGKCESVVWDVKNGKVNIDFATDTKDTVGNISFNLEVSNCDLPISFTSSLLRLLAITDEDVMLELITHETGLPTKLKISDNNHDTPPIACPKWTKRSYWDVRKMAYVFPA